MSTRKGPKKKSKPVGTCMTPTTTDLGSYVRKWRLKRGISQGQLAEEVGLAQTSITSIEIGRWERLTEHQAELFAKALRCSARRLRKWISPEAKPKTKLEMLIRSRREELGLSIEAFAVRMGISSRRTLKLEVGGNNRVGGYGHLLRLTVALEWPLSALSPFLNARYKIPESEFGKTIRNRRIERGMSMKELGKRVGVSSQYICSVELGQSTPSGGSAFISDLALVLGLDVEELVAIRPNKRRSAKVG